jgi:hypothetical protein
MVANLLVAAELIMGSINGSVHLMRANLKPLNSYPAGKTIILKDWRSCRRMDRGRKVLMNKPLMKRQQVDSSVYHVNTYQY